jgi:hypothetical protein
MRQRSGASLNLVPKAAVIETQMLYSFQGLDPIIGHSTEGSSRRTNRVGMTAVSPYCNLSARCERRLTEKLFVTPVLQTGSLSGHVRPTTKGINELTI